jgi:hypothetical protein
MPTECVVFLCNNEYFIHFLKSCGQLIANGNYKGPICLVIGNDLNIPEIYSHPFIQEYKILVKYFPDLPHSEDLLNQMKSLAREDYWFEKRFQYHKLYLFDKFFKQWDTILYLDCGISILADVAPLIAERKANRFLAHSDAFPAFEWKLNSQFTKDQPFYTKLESMYNLSDDYPQTTIMLYDTAIITDTTFDDLWNLYLEFPNSRSNDQGIIALYMSVIKKLWTPFPIQNTTHYLYDFSRRMYDKPYIAIKRDW